MADGYDPLPDLAALLAATVYMDGIPAAGRLARRLRITTETSFRVIEARLREALGEPLPGGTIESFLGGDGRRVAYMPKGAPAEEGVITGVGSMFVYVRYDGAGHSSATSPADLIFIDEPPQRAGREERVR